MMKLEELHKRMQEATVSYQELQKKLTADTTGPKPGDVYAANPGIYEAPHWCDEDRNVFEEPGQLDCELDTSWLVVKYHPDDKGLVYIVPFDCLGTENLGPFDVGSDGDVVRVGCGCWMRTATLLSSANRYYYIDGKTLVAVEDALCRLATGGKALRYEDDDEERFQRERECLKMAEEFTAHDTRMASN